ncbi:hypothetical protein FQZ97_969320 [compost metagenome]
MPERPPNLPLQGAGGAATGANRAQAEPEQVEPAQQPQYVEYPAADLLCADDGDQRGTAPDQIPRQMTAEKRSPGPSPLGGADAE